MKKILNIVLSISLLISISSCETTELDLTENPNQVPLNELDPQFLFNNIQLQMNNFVSNVAGYGSFTSGVTRQFAMTGSSIYQSAYSPSSFNGIWSSAYASILTDVKALEEFPDAAVNYSYHLGVSKIIKAYTLFTLVDLFGDVPFTEALKPNEFPNPGVTDQVEIYKAALNELNEARLLLGKDVVIEPITDFYYPEKETSNWVAVANTLELRALNNARNTASELGINITQRITTIINTLNIIDTKSEDFQFQYGTSRLNPNTRHPGYNGYYEANAAGYMSNYLMWEMLDEKSVDDPRLRYYFYRQDDDTTNEDIFTLGCNAQSAPGHYSTVRSIYGTNEPVPFCVASTNGYWGRDHGDDNGIPPDGQKRTVYGSYPAGGLFDANQADDVQNLGTDGLLGAGIQPIWLSSHTNFLKAEVAITLGIGNSETALKDAINQSIDKVITFGNLKPDEVIVADDPDTAANEEVLQGSFFPSQTVIDDYVNFVITAFSAASNNDKLNIIMKEHHIASFGNSLEVYNAYRRTGYPSNLQPSLNPSAGSFYRAAYYPANSVNNNVNAAQGEITRQIFWDKNPANFIN